jgi:hypothetical protein
MDAEGVLTRGANALWKRPDCCCGVLKLPLRLLLRLPLRADSSLSGSMPRRLVANSSATWRAYATLSAFARTVS